MRKFPKKISFEENDRRHIAKIEDYVKVKTKQLREFGYAGLKESSVKAQLELILSGEKWTDVIGGFIEKDNVKAEE